MNAFNRFTAGSFDASATTCASLPDNLASSPTNSEIADRLGRVDGALNRLESAISDLTDRLNPAMAPSVKAEGGPDAVKAPASSTLIGKRLEEHETYINRSTGKLLDILDRLGI